MKTNVQLAKEIANEANKCCSRSDGFEEAIYEFALERLQAAYRAGRDEVYRSSDYHRREDMGR